MSGSRYALVSLFALSASLCLAQNVVSAHSGTIHYFEGDVKADGVALVSQPARFPELKEKSVLTTGAGRAEILLTPGVLLRVGENSEIKMLDNRLLSTRVELISGTAMVESDDPGESLKDPAVAIVYQGFEARPVKFGVFEITASPAQVRVFKGQANVSQSGASQNNDIRFVKEGNAVSLTSDMAMTKFDVKDVDDLFVWTRDRSAYLAAGNMASAHTLASTYSSFAGGSYPAWNPAIWAGFSGGWYYNAGLGLYSFLPFAGTIYGPFGYGLYNPATIGYFYAPTYTWNGAGGARNNSFAPVPLRTPLTLPSASAALPRLSFGNGFHPTMASPARGTEPIGMIPGPTFSRGGFETGVPAPVMAAPMPVNIPAAPAAISVPMGSAPAGGSAIGGAGGAARAAGGHR